MSMFYLESDNYPSDLQCPCCHTDYGVMWQTEYGESIYGKHDVECLSCGHKFVMDVYDEVVYHAIPKEPNNE
jgi:DNA-directed RNA polymerase subunit RPC12/RpoP